MLEYDSFYQALQQFIPQSIIDHISVDFGLVNDDYNSSKHYWLQGNAFLSMYH